MSNIEQFVQVARAFSEWCLAPPEEATAEARTALSLLVRLYGHALALQDPEEVDGELEGDRTDDDTWKRVFERAGALPFNYYASVFKPQDIPADKPGVDDLADDLADIYRDLSEGLSLYGQGHVAEAESDFVWSFRSHWGRHASSAIYALHCWLADTDNW